MNTEAKLYFMLGLAKMGLGEARKLSPSKKTDDELKAREDEINTLSTAEIDIEKVYREFLFYSPISIFETTIQEGSLRRG